MNKSRRDFIKKAAIGTAGMTLGGIALSTKSYANVLGTNDRINFAIVGMNGRGKALAKAVAASKNTSIKYVCDVDSRVIEEAIGMVKDMTGNKPKGNEDIRKILEDKDVDALAIATPDHWHAPMAIMGVQAGKHVYVEKPCSHNPHEGELLVKAQKQTGKIIQMGNQQRSAATSQMAIKDIRDGLIGEPYFGKAWYANQRGPIGEGKKIEVPGWLNWELWQGPAPRKDYQDTWVHYNWHWFWHWGTGEINNNGTHEIDVCRWALGVDHPERVTSAGGRYHYEDDWEFYDTQMTSYDFPGNKTINWEGKSCNPFKYLNRGRGALIQGTKGSVIVDRGGYEAYDLGGELIKEEKEESKGGIKTSDTIGAGPLDVKHMTNFLNAIRKGDKQNSPIDEGAISNHLCHLGNIALETGQTLSIDPENGKIKDNEEAMKYWSRSYEPGWEPKV